MTPSTPRGIAPLPWSSVHPPVHTQRLAQDLESQWRMQGLRDPPARREVWKRKVEAVVDEAASLGLALRRCCEASQARQAEATQRAELFQGASSSGQVLADMDTAARRHLASSKRVLEEAYATGAGVLGSMSSQRETLKVRGRILCGRVGWGGN